MLHEFEGIGPESIVLDIGMYHGAWSREIAYRYCEPYIYGFEPVTAFYDKAVKSLVKYPKIRCFNFGLGAEERRASIHIDSDATNLKNEGDEEVDIRCIADVLSDLELNHVDLASINIEGGEYELLNYILSKGLILAFDSLLIQFHDTGPGSSDERKQIRTILSMTHKAVFCYDTVWEYWKKGK